MGFIKKYTPAWFPADLVIPLLFLNICAFVILLIPLNLYWMQWNLFLAWLPLLFSVFILWTSHGKKGIRRLVAMPLWLLWLFFFPNAPYMLTDLIHLNGYRFNNGGRFTDDYHIWFSFLHIIAGVAIGCILGVLSLIMLQRYIEKEFGVKQGWLLVGGVSVLSGVAIWLGRVLRFNSWDIVFNPIGLLQSIMRRLDAGAFYMCVIFAVMTAGAYMMIKMFIPRK